MQSESNENEPLTEDIMRPKIAGPCKYCFGPRGCRLSLWKIVFIVCAASGVILLNQQWILPTHCPSILAFLCSSDSPSNAAASRGESKMSHRDGSRDGPIVAQVVRPELDNEDQVGRPGVAAESALASKLEHERQFNEEVRENLDFGSIHPNSTRADVTADRLVLVKTHRSGSGTLARIIKRRGYRRDLTFALPKSLLAPNFLQTVKFKRDFIYKYPGVKKQKYDVLANNARYHRREMAFVIPNATFITILRKPEDQLESLFGFYNVSKDLNLAESDNPLASFMNRIGYYHSLQRTYSDFFRNGQLFDLGLDEELSVKDGDVFIDVGLLEKEFDLVLIREFFDESLLLLKKILGWEFEDILYISSSIRSDKNRYEMDDVLAEKIRKWNRGDVELYKHFNATLWWRIGQYGPGFQDDLAKFRQMNSDVFNRCVDHEEANRREKVFVPRETSELCQDLLRSDEDWTRIIRQKMAKQFKA